MLVLTRKANERIEIGNAVEVVVLSIQGNRVRLGITAPANTRIRRSELILGCPDAAPTCELEFELTCGAS